jgi:hypothetical protein
MGVLSDKQNIRTFCSIFRMWLIDGEARRARKSLEWRLPDLAVFISVVMS